MLVAIRFSQRRFEHQMNPLMLLWKQTSPPPPSDLLFVIQFQQALEPFSSILKWPSLDYLSANCTLTWGSSHCRLLIFFGMKSVKFQLRIKRKETDSHFESKVKAMYGTVPCCDVCSVLLLKFFVKHAHRPLTYIFPQRPRKGYRV